MTSQSVPWTRAANLPILTSEADFSSLSDEELIVCLRAGRGEAMTELFDRYYVTVRSIARRVLRNSEDVADVVQAGRKVSAFLWRENPLLRIQ